MVDARITIATSCQNVRVEIGDVGHMTLMLTTNACGAIAMPYFLFPADAGSIPTSTIEGDDVLVSTKAEAYMDQDLFQKWLSIFTDHVHRVNPNRHNLLILDGHNSRLLEDSLVSAAVNGIHILCLPSHLTHLLQPNDANFNFLFKKVLREKIEVFARTSRPLSFGMLAHLAMEALRDQGMSNSIRSSFRKCGVYPFDDSKAISLLAEEKAEKPFSPIAGKVLRFVREVQKEREELIEKIKEIEEKEEVFQGKRFFSSTYSQVLTSSKSIAYLRLDKIWRAVKNFKAKDLRQWALDQPEYSEADLFDPNTRKKIPMDKLKEKIYADLKKMHAVLEIGVKRWIEKNMVTLPSNEELIREANLNK